MRVALIGAGRIGSLHARLLSATDGVERLTIADALPERAASVARDVGATAAPSIDAALDDAEAVVIAADDPTETAARLGRLLSVSPSQGVLSLTAGQIKFVDRAWIASHVPGRSPVSRLLSDASYITGSASGHSSPSHATGMTIAASRHPNRTGA